MEDKLTEFEPIADEKEEFWADSVELSFIVIGVFALITFAWWLLFE